MKLIVGLGNPGKCYEKTRHNVGFMAIDILAKSLNANNFKAKANALYTEIKYKGDSILLLKPQSFINLSGEVIQKFVSYYKIDLEDILIIHDDLDLPLGTFKIKPSGSSGGHNGLKNIESHLHTKEYKRIKIGISNNKQMDTKDYVLGHLSSEEEKVLGSILEKMPFIFKDYMDLSFDLLMNKYNRK